MATIRDIKSGPLALNARWSCLPALYGGAVRLSYVHVSLSEDRLYFGCGSDIDIYPDMLSFQSTRNDSSRLVFVPEIDDHEKELLCRVDNPLLDDSAIEDSFILHVHCEYSRYRLVRVTWD